MNQKYAKIELLLKSGGLSTIKLDFKDSTIMITGSHMIISSEVIDLKTNESEEFNIITTNKVFKLDEISAYKTYLNKIIIPTNNK